MKNLMLLAVLPAALMMAGCEDVCKEGQAFKTNLMAIEANVAATLAKPDTFPATCAAFDKTDNKTLHDSATFATHVAEDYFTTVYRSCVQYHYEQRCYWSGGPHPHYYCNDVYVCDAYEDEYQRHDGYEQAAQLASYLNLGSHTFATACVESSLGHAAAAQDKLVETKVFLHEANDEADVVLTKAGCNNHRSGN